MALSPLSSIFSNSMRQQVTVYKYAGTEDSGQPIYADEGTVLKARIDIKEVRSFNDTGDEITNSAVEITVPGDADVDAYDRIDLPSDYEQGAVIREVVTATDQWGAVTHKVVRIL